MTIEWKQTYNLAVVRWYDTIAVTLVSSYLGPHPVDQVRRWSKARQGKARQEFIEIERSLIASEDNSFMGGVNLLDSFLAKYKFPNFHAIKIGLANAWVFL